MNQIINNHISLSDSIPHKPTLRCQSYHSKFVKVQCFHPVSTSKYCTNHFYNPYPCKNPIFLLFSESSTFPHLNIDNTIPARSICQGFVVYDNNRPCKNKVILGTNFCGFHTK